MVRCPTAILAAIGAALLPSHIAPIFRFNLTAVSQTVFMSHTSTATVNATAWVQSHLTALYEGANLQEAFDQTFAPACEVRLHHAVHPLQTFKDDLLARRAAATHVSVDWATELISTNDDKPDEPAVVAGALVVTRLLPFRIRVTPAQRKTHVHFSAKIEQDASAQEGDQRRITSFYYTLADGTPPIYFAVPRTEGAPDGQ